MLPKTIYTHTSKNYYEVMMLLKFPESTDETVYFTRRKLENDGKIIAWTMKKECPSCHKALMGKPVEKGKKKVRATEYVCPACGFTEEKKLHEDTLVVSVQYKCPFCGNDGEVTTQYKRKKWNGVDAYVFLCGKCNEKIGITKKMKAAKK